MVQYRQHQQRLPQVLAAQQPVIELYHKWPFVPAQNPPQVVCLQSILKQWIALETERASIQLHLDDHAQTFTTYVTALGHFKPYHCQSEVWVLGRMILWMLLEGRATALFGPDNRLAQDAEDRLRALGVSEGGE